jgi:hypothetical protein
MSDIVQGPSVPLYVTEFDNTRELLSELEVPKSVREFYEFCIKFQIPILEPDKTTENLNIEKQGRYGNQFTFLSRRIIERFHDQKYIHGIDQLNLETYFLDHAEKYENIDARVEDFKNRPLVYYPLASRLENPVIRQLGTKIEGYSEGFKHLLFMISQRYFKFNQEDYPYERFSKSRKDNRYPNCTDAEILFSERMFRKGLDNTFSTVFHDSKGDPIFIQKTGDVQFQQDEGSVTTTATCINLEPVFVEGIMYPPGTLFGMETKIDQKYVKENRNQTFNISEIGGLVPLRLSIFAISTISEREDSFGTHYQTYRTHFERKILDESDEIGIDDFKRYARRILSGNL